MLSKKSRHMRSLANFVDRFLMVLALRRSFGMNLVISGSNLDEAIGFTRRSNFGPTKGKRSFSTR